MRKPLTPTEAAMLATFLAPTADQPRSVPQTTAKPHKLQLVRNDDDDPAPGGGVVDLTKLALAVQATRDPDLMNLLVKESMPRILATARHRLRDKSLVQDCAQNVAVKLFVEGGLAAFEPGRGKFETFLFLVACDFVRRLNRKNAPDTKLERNFEADNFASARTATPLEQLVQREELNNIEKNLTDTELVGFRARLDGWTYVELAAYTGASKHAARSWMFRGMLKAREVA